MQEITLSSNPEIEKPHPVSIREYLLMDRHEIRAFTKKLTKQEKFDFQASVMKKLVEMPPEQLREIRAEFVEKLKKRQNKSIADKIELKQAILHQVSMALPKKEPIFFRKLRAKVPMPKAIREAKSPYLIPG